jgi:hypothetical protein
MYVSEIGMSGLLVWHTKDELEIASQHIFPHIASLSSWTRCSKLERENMNAVETFIGKDIINK